MVAAKTIAFLGYSENETKLIEFLRSGGCAVQHYSDPVKDLSLYDTVVSFGYRHILKPTVLESSRRPVLNLHISYLPYNRGANPNFWSWMDGTPSGVTIHEIDTGIDTGPIVDRQLLCIEPYGLTFRNTYAILFQKIEALFIARCADIVSGTYIAARQSGSGSFHRMADLPTWMDNWDMLITDGISKHQNSR